MYNFRSSFFYQHSVTTPNNLKKGYHFSIPLARVMAQTDKNCPERTKKQVLVMHLQKNIILDSFVFSQTYRTTEHSIFLIEVASAGVLVGDLTNDFNAVAVFTCVIFG